MSERFVIGRMDPCSSTIFLTKAEPSFVEDEEEPLDIGSWLTLYQGDGPPRTAILCFEPKTKRAKDIKEGDVILSDGNPYRVLNAPGLADADGEISIHAYDIFADEVTDCITDDTEEITIVATWQTRYSVRIVPPAEVISGTLVLQKQEGRIGDNPERVFKLPGGRLGPSLLYFFNAAKLCRMPITVLIYEVMGRFKLVAFGVGDWESLGLLFLLLRIPQNPASFSDLFTSTGVAQSRGCTTHFETHTQMSQHSVPLERDKHDMAEQATKEEDTEEEEMNKPLELGGYLTRVDNQPPTTTPTETAARDLSVGQAILFRGQPCEIVGRTDSLAQAGPLASRHKIALEMIELFDKGALDPLVVKATEKLKLVPIARVRYAVVGLDGEVMTLQKQHLSPARRTVADFHISGGTIGEDLAAFFAQCDDDEGRLGIGIGITLLILEAVGKFQVIGFGIGDWERLA